ncbi:hypothetical protein [Xylophilus sp.]|uniref:hypothetical protein n=1 Tax=Xylophilus sp. TaxID=2653893 RepID=UPI0013B84DB0|nr:hypothetical protein [Xylophilus sp.]KAF1043357.1 MAG: hypothetical protein GAK38_04008 [Xylophilus sp.]
MPGAASRSKDEAAHADIRAAPASWLRRLVLAAACCAAGFAANAFAAYPDRAVRIVVPFPAGGAVDAVARIVANHLAQTWNVPVVVDNKEGPAAPSARMRSPRCPRQDTTPAVRDALQKLGTGPFGGSSAEFSAFVQQELARWHVVRSGAKAY